MRKPGPKRAAPAKDKVAEGVRSRTKDLLRGKMPTDYKELGVMSRKLSAEYAKLYNHLVSGRAGPLKRRDTDLLGRLKERQHRAVDIREGIKRHRALSKKGR